MYHFVQSSGLNSVLSSKVNVIKCDFSGWDNNSQSNIGDYYKIAGLEIFLDHTQSDIWISGIYGKELVAALFLTKKIN